MLSANIAEIEKMALHINKASGEVEEAMLALLALRRELSEDIEMSVYPETALIMSDLDAAFSILERNNDTLLTLKSTTAEIADRYSDNEKNNVNALESVKAVLGSVSIMTKTTMESVGFPLLERRCDDITQGRAEELVGASGDDVEISNISGITAAVKKSFDIKQIEETDNIE